MDVAGMTVGRRCVEEFDDATAPGAKHDEMRPGDSDESLTGVSGSPRELEQGFGNGKRPHKMRLEQMPDVHPEVIREESVPVHLHEI